MTFIPQVLSKLDDNNSTSETISSSSTFIGNSSNTTGYNSVIVTISSTQNSGSCGIELQFSNDNSTFITFYSDTYFTGTTFTKTYPILKQYYKIKYTNTNATANLTLTTILSTSSQNTSVDSISAFDNNIESSLDAFGKLRVSDPNTILDIRFPSNSSGTNVFLSNNELICSYASNGNLTGTYGSSNLVINATGAGYYISQSRNYCTYQPGKSLLFMISAILNNGSNGSSVYSRLGYFDCSAGVSTVKNGMYFEYESTELCSINVSNNNTRSTHIVQSSWNIDKMDGSGPSGLTLDFTKCQLYVIDMEWLGVGRVRFGFYAFGRIHYVHQIININNLTNPYTTAINLPITTMLVSSGNVGSIKQICGTLISEGGYNPTGKPFNISLFDTAVTSTTQVAILAIRGGGPNYYHQNIIPTGFTITGSGTNDVYLYNLILYRDGNIGANTITTWANVSDYSVAQYAAPGTFNTSLGTPIIIDEGYFVGKASNQHYSLSDTFNNKILQITSNISNISDILVLSCSHITGNGNTVYATLNWQEIY